MGYFLGVPPDDPFEAGRPSPAGLALAARRRLPGSRATVGGLLVAVAGVALFTAARPAPHRPSTWYLVARHGIPQGSVLRAADLDREAIDLPLQVAGASFAADDAPVGAVTLAPIGAHQLLARSAIAPVGRAAPLRVLSFAVATDRAAAGDLVAGDRIDVLVTWTHDADATTEVIGRDLTLTAVGRPDDHGLADSANLTLSVAVPNGAEVVPLVRALRAGDVTVVRTTGVAARP